MPLKSEMLVQKKGYRIPDTSDQILSGNVPVELVVGTTKELTVRMEPMKPEPATDRTVSSDESPDNR